MGPTTADHRGVEIRYGYDIGSDCLIAHFVVPRAIRNTGGFQSSVRLSLPTAFAGDKRTIKGDTEEGVVAAAKSEIDSFLDA